MFAFAVPGVPSFGDLAWKGPVVAASDSSAAWIFPVPVLSPAGDPVPGQTMTAQANRSINAEATFLAMGLIAGDRVLIREAVGGGSYGGLWTVTAVGSAGTPWQLTRAGDGDTLAELPTGTMVIATAVLETGTLRNRGMIQYVGGLWRYVPNVTDILTVLNSAIIGTGLSSPSLQVVGGALVDTLTASTSLSTVISGTGVPTIQNGGTATFSNQATAWVRIGPLIVFRTQFTVVLAGSGAVAITLTTNIPVPAQTFRAIGDRGNVGVAPFIARCLIGQSVFTSLALLSTPTTSLTGVDLAANSNYQLSGAYIA